MGDARPSVGEAVDDLRMALNYWLRLPELREAATSVTPADALLLDHLREAGPQRMSAIAAWLGVDRSTATNHVARLAENGWARRSSDPTDGRVVIVEAEPLGVRALDETRTVIQEHLDALVGGWSEPERRELADLVTRFRELLRPEAS